MFNKYLLKSAVKLVSVTILLVGCTGATLKNTQQGTISKTDLLSGKTLFGEAAANLHMPEDNVLKLSDTMLNYLHKNISKKSSKHQKLDKLLKLMFSSGNLGITYDRSQSLTAENTFRSGSGNCLGVSYLFTSLAKELGLKTYFRNVAIPPTWSMEEEIIYRYRHMNVEVSNRGQRPIIIDSDEVNNIPTYKAERISTKNAVAQYYSNIGADYFVKNDTLNAFLYFKKAITLDPTQADFWGNLGVLYSRNGKNSFAESSFLIALGLQKNSVPTLNNMARLYSKMGKDDLMEKYKSLANAQNNKNPYYRYITALKDFDDKNFSRSLSHILWAINNKQNEPKFYYLLAQIYEKTNQPDQAKRSKSKGLEVENTIKNLIEKQAVKIKFRTKTWELPVRTHHKNSTD